MSQRIIINPGDKYNRLTVICTDGRNKDKSILYKCLCDCGKNTSATSYQLRKSGKKSCGCLRSETTTARNKQNRKYTYNIGDKFNRLTILALDEFRINKSGFKDQLVKVRCECGIEKSISLISVVSNHTKSCGCILLEIVLERNKAGIKYFAGDRFGRLVILNFVGYKYGSRLAECKCDCGIIKNITLSTLIDGGTTSCGCYAIESRYAEDPWECEFSNYNNASIKSRNLELKINRQEFETLCKSNCYYCNLSPAVKTTAGSILRNGIDRLDNLQGYILENCVPCCTVCNIMKSVLPLNDFINIIDKIYNYSFLNINKNEEIIRIPRTKGKISKQPWEVEYRKYEKNVWLRQRTLNLTIDEFKEFCINNCNYCGNYPNKKLHCGELYRNGIDRVDNNLGYEIENCITCCWNCNKMKGRLSQTDFLNKIEKIYKLQIGK